MDDRTRTADALARLHSMFGSCGEDDVPGLSAEMLNEMVLASETHDADTIEAIADTLELAFHDAGRPVPPPSGYVDTSDTAGRP